MKNLKHTPAPWHRGPVEESFTVWSKDFPIVSLYRSFVGSDEVEANCRLVTAAPDLLHAVMQLLSIYPDPEKDDETIRIFNLAQKAVDKAKGRMS